MENSLEARGSATAGVKLIQQIEDGWIHSVQLLHNVQAATVLEEVVDNAVYFSTKRYSKIF